MRSFFQLISLSILIASAYPTSAAVAQRAILVEEDADDPNKGHRFEGSVIWRTESVQPAPGQPTERVLRARVEVPDRKFAMTWSMERNLDGRLPASHVIEIVFDLPTDHDSLGISRVPGISMAQVGQSKKVGTPLAGRSVKVTGNRFLIALAASDEHRNLQALSDNKWLDVPMVYNYRGRRVLLSVEKGTAGTRALAEAFAAWGSRITPPRTPDSPPKAQARTSTGSGFLLTKSGHVVTNSHVVRDCSSISLRTFGEVAAPARLFAREDNDDLAVLKADALSGRVDATAKVRTTPSLRAGEAIVVFGFPLSGLLASTGNATVGNVTALAGLRNDPRQLQISAPVQPGNSGGPVLDRNGNVIGVVVSKLDALRVARVTDDVPQNINFAIKSSTLVNFLDARGVPYTGGEFGADLSIPDIVERAKAISVEVRCEK